MDSKTTATIAPPTQHPDFWFYDGSIILSVQNTLFRVHQTVLSNHSDHFAGLFTVPQPSGEGLIDGCHIVPLSDKGEDVVDLLKAVYDPAHFDNLPPEAELDPLLDFISGILRLSTKYAFRYLRRRCIFLLSSKFPTSFAAYDMKVASRTHESFKSDSIMRVVNLAHENNVLQILPCAYYLVAHITSWRMLEHKEGDIDWQTKFACHVGRERLQEATKNISHSFLYNFRPSPRCRQSQLCTQSRGPYAEWHLLEIEDLVSPLRPYTRWPGNALRVCLECMTDCQLQHSNGRQEVWDKLPGFFELPTWDVLKLQDA